MHTHSRFATAFLLAAALPATAGAQAAPAGPACIARSAPTLTPVVELYTSEGCSSCPPADKWASQLKAANAQGRAVVQAFHVGYWDYIGWVDRFASPAFTTRQRQVASLNNLRGIYTPQVVRNGADWPRWHGGDAIAKDEPARAQLTIQKAGDDRFEAQVVPAEGVGGSWSAYWTVTEHGHSSKVKSGENAGEFLQHDFVVRQYVPLGDYKGPARLTLRAIAADAAHPRQVNLVVFEPKSGKPLQALTLACAG